MPFSPDVGTKPGLEIFRIEKLEAIPVDPSSYGKFYSGDCYLVLNTFVVHNRVNHDLHFWQGSVSSQDERGASALRAVELDDHMGGKPIQHREVQGQESKLFMSYFPQLRYMEGGVDTAFRHVDLDAFSPKLFHLKGRRNVRCLPVAVSASSLNDGDVFVLDAGKTLYQWNGASSNRYEKVKGLELMVKIKDAERGGKSKLVFLESDKSQQEGEEQFWALLGGKQPIKAASEGGDDEAAPPPASLLLSQNGSTQTVGTGLLTRSMLDEANIFFLDTGAELYIWVGGRVAVADRKRAIDDASQYLKSVCKDLPITRLPSKAETPVFKSYFKAWDLEPAINDEEAKKEKQEKRLELDALYRKRVETEEKLIDNGSGRVQVWRIENMQKVEVPAEKTGHFYSGDSYIVLYRYKIANKENNIVYFWQGRDSSTDEKAASALLTVELVQELQLGPGTQVRVVQGREPNHFLSLFKGKMIVSNGGVDSGFKNVVAHSHERAPVRLYHVKGTTPINTRAVETVPAAASLNSGDCFVVVTESTTSVWRGSGATSDERDVADNITRILSTAPIQYFDEGSESPEFWADLGGKADYASNKELQLGTLNPRLFSVSTLTGNVRVEEIFNFTQLDLQQDSVCLLDCLSEVFVWIGALARKEDKDAALQIALDYVAKAPDNRPKDTPVYRVSAGAEPIVFTANFQAWNTETSNDFTDPYLKKINALKGSNSSSSSSSSSPDGVQQVTASMIGFADPNAVTHSYETLKSSLPAGVEASKKEQYLSDAEFMDVFKVDKATFKSWAGWKQAEAKKKVGLF